MKPQITIWSPDTCECNSYKYTDENGVERAIEYEEAVTLLREIYNNYPSSTHNPDQHPIAPDKTCSYHAKLATADEHFTAVLAENQSKNQMEGHLLENMPDHVDLVMDEDGSMVKRWKKGVKYDWSFDKKRELAVDLKGNIPLDKVALDSVAKQINPNAKVK